MTQAAFPRFCPVTLAQTSRCSAPVPKGLILLLGVCIFVPWQENQRCLAAPWDTQKSALRSCDQLFTRYDWMAAAL